MPPKNFQKIKLDIKKYGDLFNDFSLIAGEEAVKLFQENFTKQGWQGETFQPWQRKKVDNDWGILLSDNQNSLQKSIHIASKTDRQVIIATADNKPYARIHNEGGMIYVRPHKRTSKNGKRHNVKGHAYKMPKRQFMGNTPELQKRIETTFNNYLKRHSKS